MNSNLTVAALCPHVTTNTPISVVHGIVSALNRLHGDKWTKATVRPPRPNTDLVWLFWIDDSNVYAFDDKTQETHDRLTFADGYSPSFFADGPADFTIEPVRNAGGAS